MVLVGHSRGGEGVERAAIDSDPRDPWRVQGLVPIAPTAFGQQLSANVHTIVLLPYCDGDVSDLQGQAYVDGARDLVERDPALHSAVMVFGANHNFFNSEWTPGLAHAPAADDFALEDTICRPTSSRRLTALAQQTVGANYTAALVRMVNEHDSAMLQYLDEGRAMASVGAASMSVAAIGVGRKPVYTTALPGRVGTSGLLRADRCAGYAFPAEQTCQARYALYGVRAPHWIPPYPGLHRPAPNALALRWTGSGTLRLATRQSLDLASSSRIDVRLALEPGVASAVFALRLVDSSGRSVGIPSVGLGSLPGRGFLTTIWAQSLRFSLARFGNKGLSGAAGGNVDLRSIRSIELEVRGKGQAFLLDVMAVSSGLLPLGEGFAPRLDVPTVSVPEGDVGNATYIMVVPIRGAVTKTSRVFVEVQGAHTPPEFMTIDVPVGATQVLVPIPYDGDTEFIGDSTTYVLAYGIRNLEIGSYIGRAVIVEDDPAPSLTVEQTDVEGSEDSGLTWTFHLSQGAPPLTALRLDFIAPSTGTEINSADVKNETWGQWTFLERPTPPVSPSSVGAADFLFFNQGETTFSWHVPFERDGVGEGVEQVVVRVTDFVGDTMVLTGTVSDS